MWSEEDLPVEIGSKVHSVFDRPRTGETEQCNEYQKNRLQVSEDFRVILMATRLALSAIAVGILFGSPRLLLNGHQREEPQRTADDVLMTIESGERSKSPGCGEPGVQCGKRTTATPVDFVVSLRGCDGKILSDATGMR